MRKTLVAISLLLLIISITKTNAANYSIRELIPVNIETTIVTNRPEYFSKALQNNPFIICCFNDGITK